MRRNFTILTGIIATLAGSASQAQVTVHVIDVGQAESILLETPAAALLIDAGGEDTGNSRDRDHLLGYLDAFFRRRSDLHGTLLGVIVSHPHIDHTAHLPAVLRAFRVRNLVDGGDQRGSGIDSLRAARTIARQRRIRHTTVADPQITRAGFQPPWLADLARASNVDIRFLSGSRPECEDENNSSLVMRVQFRDATYLFTGDAEGEDARCEPLIRHLVRRFGGRALDVDVYKVGHHGSNNGTTTDLLTVTSPEIAVISAGVPATRAPGRFHGFFFGHPREAAVAMIEGAVSSTRTRRDGFTMNAVQHIHQPRSISKAVYCTCWDGDVMIDVDAAGRMFTVRTARP